MFKFKEIPYEKFQVIISRNIFEQENNETLWSFYKIRDLLKKHFYIP